MKFKNILIIHAAALVLTGTTYGAHTYKADPDHASIGFKVSHMVISKVKGHFGAFEGTLMLDDNDDLMKAEAVIDVSSIDTANEKRDNHLKSPDFLDAAAYPSISFKSKGVEKKGSVYVVTADITIHGVTREVEMPVTIRGPVEDPWGNTKLGYEASLTIDRTDYGLTWNKLLETGGLVVGTEVEITVDVEFAKQ